MNITEFGAYPSDGCNDQYCFEAAAAWFNARGGNGELRFKGGEYIVGRQDSHLRGTDALHLVNCSHMTITSDGRPVVIRYDPCLHYGAFDHATGKRVLYVGGHGCGDLAYYGYHDWADLGTCLLLYKCDHITIQDLEVDGNRKNLTIGGYTGDGIQAGHDALNISDSRSIHVRDLNAHGFCRDGLQVFCKADYAYHDSMKIVLDTCHFDDNDRNGFSWSGGGDLTANGTTFDLNGTGQIGSFPGAGMDIEYTYFVFYHDEAGVHDGYFNHCKFRYNLHYSVIANPGDDDLAYSYGFHFDLCTFVGSHQDYSLYPNTRAMVFTHCDIHGRSVWAFDCRRTGNLADRTVFSRSSFDESYVNPVTGVRESIDWRSPKGGPLGHNLINFNGAAGVYISQCTVHTYCRSTTIFVAGDSAYHAVVRYLNVIFEDSYDSSAWQYHMAPGLIGNADIENLSLT